MTTDSKWKEPKISTDVTPFRTFFRYKPQGESPQAGKSFTPLMGEVESGAVYEVNDETRASVLASHPEWESVPEHIYKNYLKADAEEQED